MFSESIVALPLLRLKGFFNGYLAPYNVIHRGRQISAFGVLTDDAVFPVDVSEHSLSGKIIKSVENYLESMKSIENDKYREYFYSDLLPITDEWVELSDNEVYPLLEDEVNLLGEFFNMLGTSPLLDEFRNYSRFFRSHTGKIDMRIRVSSGVFIEVKKQSNGTLVSVDFTYPSTAAIWRGAWDTYSYLKENEHIVKETEVVKPLYSLVKNIVMRHRLSFPKIETVHL